MTKESKMTVYRVRTVYKTRDAKPVEEFFTKRTTARARYDELSKQFDGDLSGRGGIRSISYDEVEVKED